jgi:multicomponent Na+:H+ antiporter subunit G
VVDTLGAGLVLAGLLLQAEDLLVAVRLLFVGLLLFFISPTATHALARAAMTRGLAPVLQPSEAPPSKP